MPCLGDERGCHRHLPTGLSSLMSAGHEKEPPALVPTPAGLSFPPKPAMRPPAQWLSLDKGRHVRTRRADRVLGWEDPHPTREPRGTHPAPARHPGLLLPREAMPSARPESLAQGTKFSRPRLLEAGTAAKAETGGRGAPEQGRQGGWVTQAAGASQSKACSPIPRDRERA